MYNINNVAKGKMIVEKYTTKPRDFSGIAYGNITPTDIDGLIEYKDKCFIFIEAKYGKGELPHGQRLALIRLCDNLRKPAILIITEYETEGVIDFATTVVREYYYNYNRRFRTPEKPGIMLREAIDNFITMIENKDR